MRDEDLAFIELVHRELRDVHWPEPAAIRARARRRSRRTALAAAAAVLAVASGSAVAVAARPGPAAPTSTASGPSSAVLASSPVASALTAPTPTTWAPADVPLDVLLQPDDVQAKTDPPLTQAGFGEGVQLDEMLRYCRTFQGLPTDWEPSRYSRSVTLLRARPGRADHLPGDLLLNQDIYRVAPDVADRIFAGMDTVLAPCREWRSSGPTQWQGKTIRAQVVHSWQVVDRDFAGDESVLLRHMVAQARNLETGKLLAEVSKPDSTAVVRVGDLVSVIEVGQGGTEADLRRLATVAAQRMCAAANPRC